MRGHLYRILNNINNKSYIGKTYSNPIERLSQHIRDSRKFPQRPLYSAFIKHGAENFSLEILGEFDEGELEAAEIQAISDYKSYGNSGYNATLGGDGSRYVIIDEEALVKEYHKSKSITKCANLFKADSGTIRKIIRSKNIPLYNIGDSQRANKSQTVLFEGIEFDNCYECAEYLQLMELTDNPDTTNVASSIRRVCTGIRKSYKKMKFEYAHVV